MRYILSLALSLFALTGAALAQTPAPANRPPPLILSSPVMQDGGSIPNKYSVVNTGQAVTPPLAWINTPAGTQSFVLIAHDIDVVMQHGMGDNMHWLVFNIPATATSLPENLAQTSATTPDGAIQLKNRNGYYLPMGPPPGFVHHYVWELYALDTKLALDSNATRADIEGAMAGHILGKGALTMLFKR